MANNGMMPVVKDVMRFEGITTRSMFGGIGYFQHDVMFLLVDDLRAYLRGGPKLTNELQDFGCQQYRYKKRIGYAKINYYDITDMHRFDRERVRLLFFKSIAIANRDKLQCREQARLRDLPNLQLSIERMLARIEVSDREALMVMGSGEAFRRLQSVYGNDLSITLLWKLEGAIQGVHFSLLTHSIKNKLLSKILPKTNHNLPYGH
ncbi:TfoX/Sxy family DNA transformation protein [Vibrio rarus]|uniref:TfoX/Sxy family DNA transformation protein n=1 Tax=Vibrio rarus TaxID=413403 RepID=UPI0021C3D9FE|nr:TfoX/Sxy family DNA transformation protein [Vibrio rarus]